MREPEPKDDLAWQYTDAYFEHDPDAFYGIIFRPTFEHLLRSFKKGLMSGPENDVAWYALRNIVYAAGCRMLSVTSSSGCTTSCSELSQSWRYFLNALSVHTELVYCRTSLMAVQALTAMVRLSTFRIRGTYGTDYDFFPIGLLCRGRFLPLN